MSPPLLEIQSLNVSGRAGSTLTDLSLALEANEIVALLGANGAGKSTLLKAIMGLVPMRGSIRLAGEEIGMLGAALRARRGLGYVPEGRRLFPGMTVRDNLLVACREAANVGAQRLNDVLALFPALGGRLSTWAWQLSGGQQQMLAIGRALMSAPRVLLLDEPSLGLAPLIVEELMRELPRLKDRGIAILLAEQDVARALAVSDRIYALARGQIVASGTPATLRQGGTLERVFLGGDIPLSSTKQP
jgi:branched-chain amino acid transport system ATP-binding protein